MSLEQDPLIGQMIQNYQIVSLLGQGGVGRVYLAKHPQIGKKIAVKVLRKEFARNQNVLARFFREAQAVNEIHHENVIDIFNFIYTPEGETFILMEYLEGRPLTALIEKKTDFSTQRIANIALQICSALYATHQKGIIHRDLKPDNIFLIARAGQKDFVKLLDFGLARSLGDYALGPNTPVGITVGTPAYMSPEQATGDPVDALTDVYALGIILYEMATGTCPFSSASPRELMKQQVLGKPQPPRERNPKIDVAIQDVILRCLQKEKRARYQNMRALALGLGYASGLDPMVYFASENSSGKIPVIKDLAAAKPDPMKALLPVSNTPPSPNQKVRPRMAPQPADTIQQPMEIHEEKSSDDLSKTIPDSADPFQIKTDPGVAGLDGKTPPEENPFRSGETMVLTESMVEATSIQLEELKKPNPQDPADSSDD